MANLIQNTLHSRSLGDGSRPSKFNFRLFFDSLDETLKEIITLNTKSVTLPVVSNDSKVISVKGREVPIRGINKYNGEFSVTFYMREDHLVFNFFHQWLLLLEQVHYYYDPKTQKDFFKGQYSENYSDYLELVKQSLESQFNSLLNSIGESLAGSFGYNAERNTFLTFYNMSCILEQRTFDGSKRSAMYYIYNIFPKAISAPNMDYSSVNSINEFTVTFAYSHFRHVTGEQNLSEEYTGDIKNKALNNLSNSFIGTLANAGSTAVNDLYLNRMLGMEIPGYNSRSSIQFSDQAFDELNFFAGLEQTKALKSKVYWRSHELGRWDNLFNRRKELVNASSNAKQQSWNDKVKKAMEGKNTVVGGIVGGITNEISNAVSSTLGKLGVTEGKNETVNTSHIADF